MWLKSILAAHRYSKVTEYQVLRYNARLIEIELAKYQRDPCSDSLNNLHLINKVHFFFCFRFFSSGLSEIVMRIMPIAPVFFGIVEKHSWIIYGAYNNMLEGSTFI